MPEKKQVIAVLGAGNIGRTLGKKWLERGHIVHFGVNDPEGNNANILRAEYHGQVSIDTIDHVLQSDHNIVLIALPGGVVESIVQKHASGLNGRIIIDASNRIGDASMHNLQYFQQYTPQSLIYRAFNTLGWENFVEPDFNGIQADLFYCGDADGEAQATVDQLIADIGLHPVYLGGDDQLSLLDALTSLWFTLAIAQKQGRHLAFKVLTDK